MVIYTAPANGPDMIMLSANAPTLDLIEYYTETSDDALHLLERLDMMRSWAESGLGDAVAQARAAGRSWESIGDVLGVTKQAAQQRFGTT